MSRALVANDWRKLSKAARKERDPKKFVHLLKQLYDVVKWGPTSANAAPARFAFLRSKEAKERLRPALDARSACARASARKRRNGALNICSRVRGVRAGASVVTRTVNRIGRLPTARIETVGRNTTIDPSRGSAARSI